MSEEKKGSKAAAEAAEEAKAAPETTATEEIKKDEPIAAPAETEAPAEAAPEKEEIPEAKEEPEAAAEPEAETPPAPEVIKEEKPKGPTPAEQSEALKEAKAKEKKSRASEQKSIQAIHKSSLYSKVFPAGQFPGNSVSAHAELVKEAAVHLLTEGHWNIENKPLDDGSVIQYIKK